jgi:hypothetical protein
MRAADALTQETIFGMADGATYSGTLCLSRDGKRYYFAQAQVDGHNIPLPGDHWRTREAAVRGLADIACGARKPRSDSSPPPPAD